MKQSNRHGNGASDPIMLPLWKQDRGAALLLVIVLSTIALLIMTTVLYMIMTGTELSGAGKRYRTAYEAALGGADIIKAMIQAQSAAPISNVTMNVQQSFSDKLASTDLSNFTTAQTEVTIDPTDASTYDLTMDLGNPVYRVYAKMVTKKQGNTQVGYKLVRVKTGVIPSNPSMGQLINSYYTFEILAQSLSNPEERARMELVEIF